MKTTRFLLWMLLTGVVLAASSALAKAAVEPTLMLRLADQHRALKQYSEAISIYKELTTLRPGSPAPRVRLGQIYLAQGRWVEAESEFLLARGINPRETGALCGLAEVAYHRGDLHSAISLWRAALALNPSNSEARYRLSRAYIDTSRFSQAEHELHRILLQETDHQGAHYLLGLMAAMDDRVLAVEHLQTAATGQDSALVLSAVDMLEILNDIGATTRDAQVADRLARWYLRYEMPSLALSQLERITKLDPSNDTARAYSGYALFSLGRHDLARTTLRQATQDSPDNPLGHYFLGVLHRSEGYHSTALWDFKRSLRLDPSNAAAYAEIAQTYLRLGQYVAAEEWYRAATSVAPEEPGFRLLLAEFYVEVVPKPQQGLTAATEAVALAPDEPEALGLLGWALFMSGDASAARAVLERSITLDPDEARSYYYLGVVCDELGDVASAEWAYQRAIDLDTDGAYREKALRERHATGS